MNRFEREMAAHAGIHQLTAERIRVLQVNLGLRCNLSCAHCHVQASPEREESMGWPVMQQVLAAARQLPGCLVDLTGGAPELNPHFRRFVTALRADGHPVQVRTNLAVFFEPGLEDLPEFFREHRVRLVGSLPCYLEENVAAQRGVGVYQRAVEALRRLNTLGYGRSPSLPLDLVYNPGGPFLPPDQGMLESAYRQELGSRFGLQFSRLLTIANMPLGRFLAELERDGRAQGYRTLLEESFNPSTLDGLMCRHQVCVAWDGTLYDCDFNLALGMPIGFGAPSHVDAFHRGLLEKRRVVTDDHCLGCTAGCGSSCGGALVHDGQDSAPRAAAAGS